MTEVSSSDHGVVVAPTHLRPLEVSLIHEVVDDLLHGPLGDPDRLRHVASAGVWIPRQRDQDVPVVGQEGPAAIAHLRQVTRVPVRRTILTYETIFVNDESPRGEYPGFGVTVSSAGSVRPGASAASGGGGDLRRLA